MIKTNTPTVDKMKKKMISLLLIILMLTLTLGCGSTPTQSTTTSTSSTDTSSKYKEILVTIDNARSFITDNYKSGTTGSPYYAEEGKCFFMLYVIVENVGCSKEISTHPWGFEITIDNVVYGPDTYIGTKELQTVDLLKGGKTEGYVVFDIPISYLNKEFRYSILYQPLLSGYGCEVEYKFIETDASQIPQEKEEVITNEPTILAGTGNKIVSFNANGTGVRTFIINHIGTTGSFKIILYDNQEKYVSTLIMSRGQEFDSKTTARLTSGKYYLEVTASGYWTIEIQ